MTDRRQPSDPASAHARKGAAKPPRPPRDPVLASRHAAVRLLQAVLDDGRALDEPFETETRLLEPRDRAFVRLLVTTTLRRLGQIDGVLKAFLQRPIARRHGAVKHVLRLAAAQILVLETPAHAAVDTSVELTKFLNAPGLTGLVNAVTRRLARDGAAVLADQDVRLNTPRWLWQTWLEAYGDAGARRIAEAHLHEPPLDITVKADAAGWAERLEAEVLPTGSLRRRGPGMVASLPGYGDGAWWVQDAAAALPARLLGDVVGKTVVDLCAAPGGKTAQLAAAGAHVIAVDRSGARLARLHDNMARLGLAERVTVVEADATVWRPDTPVDAVLLDAPCTATGTIRRHPEALRLKKAADAEALTALQDALLAASAEMVKPDGTVVYCVCSLQPEEGAPRLAAAVGLTVDPVRPEEIGGLADCVTAEGYLRTLPFHLAEVGGMDGFFAARLRRT
ncbi:RsmB/NOP family class I SAM-dependent RNA methyltransferase [Caenispirillum salinarum]|uniref:RsmB/NOP family class I SAM-dependent RNA methyltransferase n=1 Tax=Caenispirillum salinarum TaxID=859058 RepID=UPI00384F38A0